MKKLLSLLLAFALILMLMPSVLAASEEQTQAADALHTLGLFQGTGTKADGTPNYDLDRAPTRNEAVTMLIRLLGKESEAKAGKWETPFTDVAQWAQPYVGYAYANGLTNGTSATAFGGESLVSAAQYLTFVLRALGYDSGSDFQWDASWELSDKLGITQGEYSASNNSRFVRGNAAEISVNALPAKQKGSDEMLAQKLIADGVFTEAQYRSARAKMNGEVDPNTPENLALYQFTYDAKADGYVISDYNYKKEARICIIPSEYRGKPVVAINQFFTTDAEVIRIPSTIQEVKCFENIFKCREFIVAGDNPSFCAVDGVLMNKDKTELIRYPSARLVDSYHVPDTVTKVDWFAFRGGYEDRKMDIVIPASVTYIGEWAFNAFSGSNLTVRVEGSTKGWHPNTFCIMGDPIHVESSDPLDFHTTNMRVYEDQNCKLKLTAVEYANNGKICAVRVRYNNPYQDRVQCMMTLLDEKDGYGYPDNRWLHSFEKGEGEFTFYAPIDFAAHKWDIKARMKVSSDEYFDTVFGATIN